MTVDHVHHFLVFLIGQEMGGSPTSFHTRSPKLGVRMWENEWEKWCEILYISLESDNVRQSHGFRSERTRIGYLNTLLVEYELGHIKENPISTVSIFLVVHLFFYFPLKTQSQISSTLHYVPWQRVSKHHFGSLVVTTLAWQPWPQESLS